MLALVTSQFNSPAELILRLWSHTSSDMQRGSVQAQQPRWSQRWPVQTVPRRSSSTFFRCNTLACQPTLRQSAVYCTAMKPTRHASSGKRKRLRGKNLVHFKPISKLLTTLKVGWNSPVTSEACSNFPSNVLHLHQAHNQPTQPAFQTICKDRSVSVSFISVMYDSILALFILFIPFSHCFAVSKMLQLCRTSAERNLWGFVSSRQDLSAIIPRYPKCPQRCGGLVLLWQRNIAAKRDVTIIAIICNPTHQSVMIMTITITIYYHLHHQIIIKLAYELSKTDCTFKIFQAQCSPWLPAASKHTGHGKSSKNGHQHQRPQLEATLHVVWKSTGLRQRHDHGWVRSHELFAILHNPKIVDLQIREILMLFLCLQRQYPTARLSALVTCKMHSSEKANWLNEQLMFCHCWHEIKIKLFWSYGVMKWYLAELGCHLPPSFDAAMRVVIKSWTVKMLKTFRTNPLRTATSWIPANSWTATPNAKHWMVWQRDPVLRTGVKWCRLRHLRHDRWKQTWP